MTNKMLPTKLLENCNLIFFPLVKLAVERQERSVSKSRFKGG